MAEPHPLFNQPLEEFMDLWKKVHAVGIEGLEIVSEYEWNFSNLDDAFEEGGMLHGERVYLFSSAEPQLLLFDDQWNVTNIPTVVAIVSPSAPSDKIAVLSTISGQLCQRILPLRRMNMDWVPYPPPGRRVPVEILEPQIFILSSVHRRADLEDWELQLLPYLYNPLLEDEQSTIVNIIYPSQPEPFACMVDIDCEMEDVEGIINEAIAANRLTEDRKDDFEDFVWKRVLEQRIANDEARQDRVIARASEIAAIQNMRFYKFYPVATADTPDISKRKSPFINRFYGRADQVF